MADIKSMTLEELLAVPYSKTLEEIGVFKGFIIVPTGDLHDSGFGCMKFVLTLHDDIVGAVGGWCDVVHLNGIGGYGLGFRRTLTVGEVPPVDWSIDLLPGSGCLRVFSSHKLVLDDFIGSDFIVYDGGLK